MSKEAMQWCNDALHDLLGFADTALASYLVSLARKAKSHDAVVRILREGEVKASETAMHSFAIKLMQQVNPNSSSAHSNNNKQRKTNADWIEAAAKYAPVTMKVEEDILPQLPSASEEPLRHDEKKSVNREKKKEERWERKDSKLSNTIESSSSINPTRPRKRRYREDSSTGSVDDKDEEEGEEGPVKGAIKIRQRAEERRERRRRRQEGEQSHKDSALTAQERMDLDRQKDLQERDEFAQRLLDRDKVKTKQKVTDDKMIENDKAYHERIKMEERLTRGEKVKDENTGQEISLDRLREESRSQYLKKREERELALLKQSLEDEQEFFQGAKLTDAEKKRIELGRRILGMAGDREQEDDADDGFYRLPGEYSEKDTRANQNQSLLSARYREPKNEKSEQEQWEESQTKMASGLGPKKKAAQDNYNFVLDDQVEFVMQEKRKGYDDRSTKIRKADEQDDERRQDPREIRAVTEHEKMLEGRTKLPVFPYREEFLAAVKEHQILILCGETGSGKTTQLPQYLHEIGYSELGRIGCTQPRRVAAMSVAARVATEMNVRLGHEVGYSIRFENCTSPKTKIQYMTDGMLLREILTEPDLASYSCMVIDEAHERSIHTDVLMALIKDIVRFRNDLRLIISSATLDAEKFSTYFDDASIFMIPGRMFPVDIYYTKAPEADYVDAAIVTCLQIHVSQPLNGDILIFLTGQDEIETASEILTQRARNLGGRIPELIICPIYANLPSDQQAKIFEKTPKSARKVVIGTNIAETSLTIDGICYVIDSGFQKQKSYNARSGMESLVVVPVSQAAANQRAGRAGRTQPGKAFRLYTAWSFQQELDANTIPEILRTNMSSVVLMLKSLGINDLINFDFLDKPPADALIRALEQLYALGALNDRGELTKLGRRMAEFPLDPMLSKAVIVSEKYQCVSEVLSCVSMLSLGASVFYRPKEKKLHADTARLNFARGGGGDHMALMRCYKGWAATDYSTIWCHENFVQIKTMRKARDIREQLQGLCERVEIDHSLSSPDDIEIPLKAITAGFFYNVAKLSRSGEYQTIKQHKTVYIHPSSVLSKDEEPPMCVVFFELTFTTKEYMRQIAPIQAPWLVEIAPHYYQESDVQDSTTKKMPKSKNR